MARYTCSYIVKVSPDRIDLLYDDLLRVSSFEVIHRRPDFLVALETPGEVMFARLISIELSLKPISPSEIHIDLLVKNHELPLKTNNRCRQFFEELHGILTENYSGKSLLRITA